MSSELPTFKFFILFNVPLFCMVKQKRLISGNIWERRGFRLFLRRLSWLVTNCWHDCMWLPGRRAGLFFFILWRFYSNITKCDSVLCWPSTSLWKMSKLHKHCQGTSLVNIRYEMLRSEVFLCSLGSASSYKRRTQVA